MKRCFDIVLSTLLLISLAPMLITISALVLLFIGRPLFFVQTRPGLNARPFKMIKFRTMSQVHGTDGLFLSDEERLTKFGRLLRSLSLDELPELINVLRGDMSLVGPRPLLMEYLPLYNSHQKRRHEVRPGITGWAQVNGRNNIGWSEKFDLDVWYVDNRTFWLDLKILVSTVISVIKRKDIYKEGHATTDYFKGNEK